jgi:hypothetical protein
MQLYCVVKYTKAGKFIATISGMGRNKNTLDTTHGKRAVQCHARQCRIDDPKHDYRVEETV